MGPGNRTRLAVFVSGGGSNLQAILDACRAPDYPAEVVVVVCNRPGAGGIERARRASIPVEEVDHRPFKTRQAHEQEILRRLTPYRAELCVLAGYLRVVTPLLIRAFPGNRYGVPGVVNIHPADTRAYQGTHGYEFALGLLPGSARLAETRITVHFVDQGVDTGPIIAQQVLPVRPEDTLDALRARGLEVEHRLYPEVIRAWAEGRIRLECGKVTLLPRETQEQGDRS
jgi:phosphoribosylglycinamide formyltransferase-1